ncbi:MAG: hypothetical protein RMY29_021095 [Nostoc sp. CreGUA01]|nr:hypothetical protein [Nostoc sp. CreGUA01]
MGTNGSQILPTSEWGSMYSTAQIQPRTKRQEKSGCSGVITHVGDYSCTLDAWDAEYTVKIEHLKSLELSDNDCQFMHEVVIRKNFV